MGGGQDAIIPEIARRVSGTLTPGAFTNTALDKMLMALLDSDPSVRFSAYGPSGRLAGARIAIGEIREIISPKIWR
jgi:hypothetical protein